MRILLLFIGVACSLQISLAQNWVHPEAVVNSEDEVSYFLNSDRKVVTAHSIHEFKRTAVRKNKRSPFEIKEYDPKGTLRLHTFSDYSDPISQNYRDFFLQYSATGDTLIYQPYSDNKKDGVYRSYYENGQLKERGKYVDGLREGVWRIFHEDGSLHEIGSFENYRKVNEWITYYPNGNEQEKGRYNKGLKNEVWKTFHENGAIASEVKYVEAKRVGDYTAYNENGNVSEKGRYEDDLKTGNWLYYDEAGQLIKSCSYDLGAYAGDYFEFTSKGDTLVAGKLIDNEMNAYWKFYYPNGDEKRIEAYDAGYLAKAEHYWPNGQLKRSEKGGHEEVAQTCFTQDGGAERCRTKWNLPMLRYESLDKFLNEHMQLPPEQSFESRIVIKFSVDFQGTPISPEIVESSNQMLDVFIEGAITAMPWIGGTFYNEPATYSNHLVLDIHDDGSYEAKIGTFYLDDPSIVIDRFQRVDGKLIDQESAIFTGGDQALFEFIGAQTRFPEFAKDQNITGICYVEFDILPSGIVANARMLKTEHPSLDYEALRVVNALPLWEPARTQGKEVTSSYKLPFRFTLK